MTVIPPNKADMISFFASRLPVWTENAAQIGLSQQAVGQLSALLNNAQSLLAEQAARDAEKRAATAASNQAADALRAAGAGDLATIKAFAKSTNNPAVYTLAQIPAPAAPTPAAPPTMPYDLVADIDNNGDVVLTFKSDNAQSHTGVFFVVRRKLAGQSAFTLVGTSGVKSFTDKAIPQGTTSAVYNITAKRGDLSSPTSENIYVPFASSNSSQQDDATAGSIQPEGQKGEVA